MNCEDLRDDYEMYALGALSGDEAGEIAAHLARACPTCSAGIREAQARNAMIAVALAPDAQPSNALRARVLAIAGARKQSRWLAWAMVPVAAAAGFVLGILRPRTDPADARLAEITSFLGDPQTVQTTFQPGPRGRVFVHPNRGVLLIATNLPALRSDQTFELWTVPPQGAPRPAGLFRAEQGQAVFLSKVEVDRAQVAAVAVSIEPAQGSPAPTTTPIIIAPLPPA